MADLSDNWGHEPTGEYHRGARSSIRASWDTDDEPTRMSWDSDDEPTPVSWDPDPDQPTGVGAALRDLADQLVHAAHDAGQVAAGLHQRQATDDDADGM